MKPYYHCLKLSVFVAGLLWLSSCNRDIDESFIPEDTTPAITLVSPTQNNLLAAPNTALTATFKLSDNEALKVFRVVRRVYDTLGTVIGTDFIEVEDTSIQGDKQAFRTLSYTVPNLPYYYKVRLTCYAIDTKGTFSSAFVTVNVVPGPVAPPPYLMESYTNDKLYGKRAINNKHFFSYKYRAYINNTLDKDIEETSSLTNADFVRKLISPNNQLAGSPDSVFVITDASRFNYDDANYNYVWEAFYSDPLPKNTTPALEVGDIVITRLSNKPHFAVMRITSINDAPGDANDYLVFDYKYSY